jgi:hypothetical protein
VIFIKEPSGEEGKVVLASTLTVIASPSGPQSEHTAPSQKGFLTKATMQEQFPFVCVYF